MELIHAHHLQDIRNHAPARLDDTITLESQWRELIGHFREDNPLHIPFGELEKYLPIPVGLTLKSEAGKPVHSFPYLPSGVIILDKRPASMHILCEARFEYWSLSGNKWYLHSFFWSDELMKVHNGVFQFNPWISKDCAPADYRLKIRPWIIQPSQDVNQFKRLIPTAAGSDEISDSSRNKKYLEFINKYCKSFPAQIESPTYYFSIGCRKEREESTS